MELVHCNTQCNFVLRMVTECPIRRHAVSVSEITSLAVLANGWL